MTDKNSKTPIILFDLDGTLIDSTEAILKCFDDSYKHFDMVTPSDEKIKALIGHPLDYMYTELGVEKDRVWDFVAVYKSHYKERSKPMTVFLPYAKEAIKEASQFARLGIVTTKTGEYSRILLEHMGVMEYFEVLIGREDVEFPKPHAEPILKALSSMGVDYKDNVFMIGDTCMDMISAKSVGIQSIGVTCGYGTQKQLETCTQNIVIDTKRAISYIKQIIKL
jgi:phosphoglycolate phosphatase